VTRRPILLALAVTALATGCGRPLDLSQYPTPVSLFEAGMARYNDEKWNDAILAFERLTLDLPTRDSLLPLAHWHLAQSRLKNDERLLAAQAFLRLAEQLPDDTLADDAIFEAGRAYSGLWRRPELDPQYGLLAETQFRLLLALYPESRFADSSRAGLRRIDDRMAKKDYDIGMHYVRRKAYDSAIIFLKDVVRNHPESDVSRHAMLRLVEVYRLPLLNYQDDAAEVCAALRAAYPTDPEVLSTCKLAAADSTAVPPAAR
jgi:outer membrane protein assembly factor BamD